MSWTKWHTNAMSHGVYLAAVSCRASCKNEPALELQILLCGAILRSWEMKSSFSKYRQFLSGCSWSSPFFRVYGWVHSAGFVNRGQGWTHLAGAPLALSLLPGGSSSFKHLSQKHFTYPAFKTPGNRHHTGAADKIEDHSIWLLLFGKAQTHSWCSALCWQLLSLLRAGNAGSWYHVCKPPPCPQLLWT